MTVSKITQTPSAKDLTDKINEVIDNLGGGGSSSLSGLSDVTITSATSGDALVYNGSNWVNGTKTKVIFRVWS